MLQHKPAIDLDSVRQLLIEEYDLEQSIECLPLPGERDQNFLVKSTQGKFVLKVFNCQEEPLLIEAQADLLDRLETLAICPRTKPTREGNRLAEWELDGTNYRARVVTYLDGCLLNSVRYKSPSMLRDLGEKVARIGKALEGFDHPAFHYEFEWCLEQGVEVVDKYRSDCQDIELTGQIDLLMERFQSHTAQHLDGLPKSVIHNDANDGNVVLGYSEATCLYDEVTGIIDIGDAIYSWTVGDLAIAIAYAILGSPQPLQDAVEVVKGYHGVRTLSCRELDALFGLVCLRLCVSACMAAKQTKIRPDDEYLNISQEPIKATMPRLVEVPFKLASAMFRDACGCPAIDSCQAVTSWLQANEFDSVLRPAVATSELVLIDWSVENPNQDNVLELDLAATDQTIERILEGGKVGVGRYAEPRLVYAADQFGGDDGERRTIHLGVDLFAPAGTEVVAPLDGTVVVRHEIKMSLDYGTLLILEHATTEGERFYTLYGHLDWGSTSHLSVGSQVKSGEMIAQLGTPEVNGGWSPHLHFQLMLDLLDYDNDFPGVAKVSELDAWLQICPNPNLILGLAEELTTYSKATVTELLERRRKILGGDLSIGYRRPINVVRGQAQYLFDRSGRKYLDAYNNVPHIGHCHPAVIDAVNRQMRLINTNTRYLHDNILNFAEALTATMPDPLNVCYFLNSASEANELAIRMMRSVTGANDIIVLGGAYHGHTSNLIEISPYKHDGPGGRGRSDWVHTAPVADVYRGEFRDLSNAGPQFARMLAEICQSIREAGRGLSGFIAESCPSVGGQIIFPPNYLAEVYETVRQHGGLCVADDVQTGYGRLGSAFYGFELQGVTPDIVILGKPIGNGHPLAALVTTREIADRFNQGMEFFSTFGGNNVSCAVGLAVLETVKREGLQQHALEVGDVLLSGMRELQSQYEIIGDVRGSGLFLGMELVRDPQTLEPAAAEASMISNRMRDRGILIGTDGPLHNVIKIRPPMPFDRNNARRLLGALDSCFEELVG